ncbi:MFS transporter [Actinomadura sp. 7K507]|uniref:MFS transporter n=1 Tax=Actinomadura sp. 7K507 TaxID=2530365 RepID=UPI0010451B4B|nr:MFS transporter [Actinomadura sp. 7K507]TDC94563.1 MFS transporter [Actinomadura sp. 7K507]
MEPKAEPIPPERPGTDSDENSASTPRAEVARLTIALVAAAISLGFGVGTFLAMLPGLAALVGLNAGQLIWLSAAQLLCTVVAVPIVGRLGDMFGHRRMMFLAVAVTGLGGLLLATGTSFAVLLIGRVMQGLIGSIFPLGAALVRDRLRTSRGNTVIAAFTASMFLGSVAGLLTAAGLSDAENGTRLAFWIAFGVFAAAAAITLGAPESVVRAKRSMDVRGAVVLAVGLGGIVLGLSEVERSGWGDARTAGYLVIGLLILVGWVRLQASTRHPLIDVRGMANRRVLPGAAIALAYGVAQYGATTATVTFMASPADKLGYGLSMSIREIALLLAPCAVVAFLSAVCAARLAALAGARAVLVGGGALITLGFISMIAFHDSTTSFTVALVIQFAGQGIVQAMWPTVLSAAAEATKRGAVTSVGQSLETLGGGLSNAIFAAIFGTLVIAGTDVPTESAYEWVWITCAGITALIIPLAYVLRTMRRSATAE